MIMTQLRSVFFLSIGLMGLFTLQPFAMELARDGQSRYTVAVAVRANAAERFAAEELTNFLYQITGAVFPIVEETGLPTGTPALYVGPTEFTAGQGVRTEDLGPETWVLRTVGDNLILAGGRPRGTLYAVYEFLETYGGCRWVSHDLEVVPAQSDFRVPVLDEQDEPAFIWRTTSYYNRHDGGPDSPTKEGFALYLVRNRNNGAPYWLDEPRFGYAIRFGRPYSTHTFYLYQKDWKDVQPEFFAMLPDGKRAPRPANALGADFCLANPELRDRFFAQLLAYIEQDRAEAAEAGRPAPDTYAISQNDTSGNYCRCPDCNALAEREGSYVGVMIDFVNDLADRVRARHPEIKLLTEAYQFTKEPPKTIRPRDNVILRLALLDREYFGTECADVIRPITEPINADARRITDGWAAIVPRGNLCVFDYFMPMRAPFRYPYDATAKITRNLEYWHALGIRRIYQLDTCSLEASFRNLCDWLFFQKSVHPERATGRLVDDYMAGYYGPAAAPMREHYDRLVEGTLTTKTPFALTPPPLQPYLTADFFRATDALLDRAEALCAGEANAKYLRNVVFERIPVDSAQLHMWHRFADLPGFAGRKEAVLQRYEANKRRFIRSFSTDVHAWVNFGRQQFDAELSALRIEPPEEFKGRNATVHYMVNSLQGISRGEDVRDPDAAGGVARRLGGGQAGEHKLPFVARIHDNAANHGYPLLRLEKVPSDEKYHWHHLGAIPLTADCGLWSSVYIWAPMGWAAVPPPHNELDVYISLKFTGPTYVPGSTKPDAVLMDRILVAQPAAPAGEAAANPTAKVLSP